MGGAFAPPGAPDDTYILTTKQSAHAGYSRTRSRRRSTFVGPSRAGLSATLGARFLIYVAEPIGAFCWLARTLSDA